MSAAAGAESATRKRPSLTGHSGEWDELVEVCEMDTSEPVSATTAGQIVLVQSYMQLIWLKALLCSRS
jgi:hypothetical protein